MTGTSLGTPVRHTRHASPGHEPPAAIRAAGIIVVLTVVLAILAIAFALPAARSKPHDVPIGAAGPMAASGRIADILEQHAPAAFAITYYPGEERCATRSAIAMSTAASRLALTDRPGCSSPPAAARWSRRC
jgi:hypothetical protein